MPESVKGGLVLILFGAPGSGKGTQARLLQEKLQLPHIATGDMLRERMRRADEQGERIRGLLEAGNLVTDDLITEMLAERTAEADCSRGFLLDGYPRTVAQAEWIFQCLAGRGMGWVVIHLKVDYNEIIRRLAGRRTCVRCGPVFHQANQPPVYGSGGELCGKCGTSLIVREDDREGVIRHRLAAYDESTKPVLDWMTAQGVPFREVDGAGQSPEEIAQRIVAGAKFA
ncbi:MAG: nucleoside monophosphate kinase [Candidatus Solibacter usitatus]|nr:nucleoside monophosphate kinase [Candidatus Solibacter usitatus]